MPSKIRFFYLIVIFFVFLLGFLLGKRYSTHDNIVLYEETNSSYESTFSRVEELLHFIDRFYFYKLDREQLTRNILDFTVGELDQYSHYIPHANDQELELLNDKRTDDLGIEFYVYNDTVFVESVNENSAADRFGIQPMDRILAIDTIDLTPFDSLAYKNINEYLSQKTPSVPISILRDSSVQDLLIERSPYYDNPVTCARLDSQTIYVKISKFPKGVYSSFLECLDSLVTDERRPNAIIDLRNNPGGRLSETIDILNQLINQKGSRLAYSESSNGERIDFKSNGRVLFPFNKIIVLINHNSASGSELIAASVQDLYRGKILGYQSFGKGVSQEIFVLNNGDQVYLTSGAFYTDRDRGLLGGKIDTTLQPRILIDSTKHFTHGVIPDYQLPDCEVYKSFDVSQFVFNLIADKGWTISKPTKSDILDSMKNMQISNQSFCNSLMINEIEQKLLSMFYGDDESLDYDLQHDPFIIEAIEHL